LLIETHGADFNARDSSKNTPLHYALWNFNPRDGGDITVLTYLLTQKKINENIKGKSGYTILHRACKRINRLPLEVFTILIETLGCDVNVQNKNNDTPLHDAFRCFDPNDGCDINVLTYLINQKNVNGNMKGWNGYTLLHMACININKLPLDIFNVLIGTMGCDVNVQDDDKDTPLHDAFRYFNPNKGGDIKTLTYLLTQTNINVDIKGKYCYTLLHRACKHINRLPREIFKLLIEKLGIDVNAQNNNKNTPLHHALHSFNLNDGGDITVLTYLLSHKNINANIKGDRGYTLLHYACPSINRLPLEIFKVLIETRGADVNAQNESNNTPLHLALYNFNPSEDAQNVAILTYLLSHKNINLNIKGKNDLNLLHWACINNLSKSRDSAEFNAECDTILCQIVEVIVERCAEQIFDEGVL
jgi:ankyrin repeat protein